MTLAPPVTETLDVIYPVRPGDNNEELRFSLRSLEAHYPHARVVIVGYKPVWVTGVEFIPGNPQSSYPRANIYQNILAACKHIDGTAVCFNDDFFITEPLTEIPVLYRSTLDEHLKLPRVRAGATWWRQSLETTRTCLQQAGITDPLSYELHTPFVVDTKLMVETLERFAHVSPANPPQWRTLYGNLHNIGGRPHTDGKCYRPGPVRTPFHSTDDSSFRHFRAWFENQFPEPCRYEKDDPLPVDTLTEPAALDWLRDRASQIPPDQAIVELGTYRGGSLKYLVEGSSGSPVFGVDAWGLPGTYEGRPHMLRRYKSIDKRVAARIAKGAHLIHALTMQAAQEWTGPKIGLLYIDAEHKYPSVMRDFRAWEPHLTPDALVVFDDYEPSRIGAGVMQAVDELVASGELEWVQLVGSRLAVTTR